MRRNSAEALRNSILAEVGREHPQEGATLHTLAKQPPSDQLAVGLSRDDGPGASYAVEVRVQRADGTAFEVAERYRADHPGDVHLHVVPRVDLLPNLSDLGVPHAGARLPPPVRGKTRILQLGHSVGRVDHGAGTLGAFVRVTGEDDTFILSCNHVLAKLNAGTRRTNRVSGDPIYHPGKPDQRPLGAKFRVAELDDWIDLAPNTLNQYDAAVARVNADVDHTGTVIPAGCPSAGTRLTRFTGDPVADIRRDHGVATLGRTSGYSRGKVTAVGLGPLPVYAPPIGKLLFEDVIEVVGVNAAPFSRTGDSGGLVFLEDSHEAVGLVFAGGPVVRDGVAVEVSYVCLLAGILDYFNARLV